MRLGTLWVCPYYLRNTRIENLLFKDEDDEDLIQKRVCKERFNSLVPFLDFRQNSQLR
jgi:hypothetical protein